MNYQMAQREAATFSAQLQEPVSYQKKMKRKMVKKGPAKKS